MRTFGFLLLLLLFACRQELQEQTIAQDPPIAIVIHGGAGYITPDRIDSTKAAAYHDTLQLAIQTAYALLEEGGTAVDAVEAAIKILEDCSLFNAGKGAVYNHQAQQEMDASIMDGTTLNCGAVTGVRYIRNPIKAARLVMDSSEHVMLAGRGAELLASQYGLELEDSAYFYDSAGYDRIQRIINAEKYGTVGAVALDRKGNIAAGTSTGGMMNKRWNRIGDSPIIGAGTYANNKSCGVSCTGHGEYFIRTVAAANVHFNYLQNQDLDTSLFTALKEIEELGAKGGMIALDHLGQVAWRFNTPGMFRAYKHEKQGERIMLFGEDDVD